MQANLSDGAEELSIIFLPWDNYYQTGGVLIVILMWPLGVSNVRALRSFRAHCLLVVASIIPP